MSATNLTKNLKLPQFVTSDKPSWLGDVNGAMLNIDNGIGTIKSDITKANDTASSAKSQSDANTVTLGNVNTELESIGNRVTALEAGGGTEQLEQKVNTNTSDIEALQTRADAFEEEIADNGSKITSVTNKVTELEPKVTANEQSISRLDNTVNGLTETVESTSTTASNALQTASSANSKATQAQTTANNANASVNNLNDYVTIFHELKVTPNYSLIDIGNEERINFLKREDDSNVYFNFLPFAFKVILNVAVGTSILSFTYNSSYTVDETSVGANNLIYVPNPVTNNQVVNQFYLFNDSDNHTLSLIYNGTTTSNSAPISAYSPMVIWRIPQIHFTK